mmetsp:Transcript_19022/g.61262  ORF Transcript_19022/g.61262 Transcript_19022/m.61262 type:complete len:223 (-) Transcript_19022:375-1043(-)
MAVSWSGRCMKRLQRDTRESLSLLTTAIRGRVAVAPSTTSDSLCKPPATRGWASDHSRKALATLFVSSDTRLWSSTARPISKHAAIMPSTMKPIWTLRTPRESHRPALGVGTSDGGPERVPKSATTAELLLWMMIWIEPPRSAASLRVEPSTEWLKREYCLSSYEPPAPRKATRTRPSPIERVPSGDGSSKRSVPRTATPTLACAATSSPPLTPALGCGGTG